MIYILINFKINFYVLQSIFFVQHNIFELCPDENKLKSLLTNNKLKKYKNWISNKRSFKPYQLDLKSNTIQSLHLRKPYFEQGLGINLID